MDLIGKADYNKQATQNGVKSILKSNWNLFDFWELLKEWKMSVQPIIFLNVSKFGNKESLIVDMYSGAHISWHEHIFSPFLSLCWILTAI